MKNLLFTLLLLIPIVAYNQHSNVNSLDDSLELQLYKEFRTAIYLYNNYGIVKKQTVYDVYYIELGKKPYVVDKDCYMTINKKYHIFVTKGSQITLIDGCLKIDSKIICDE